MSVSQCSVCGEAARRHLGDHIAFDARFRLRRPQALSVATGSTVGNLLATRAFRREPQEGSIREDLHCFAGPINLVYMRRVGALTRCEDSNRFAREVE